MKEGQSIVECLLAIDVYEISENYIKKLRDKNNDRHDVFEHLPKFTINNNKEAKNQPIIAEYFLQFVGYEESDRKYIMFNFNSLDPILQEEISSCGEEDIFKEIDFSKILQHITPMNDEDLICYSLGKTNYLIVELVYNTSQDHYSGGWETDLDVNIIGYLDNNLNKRLWQKL